MHVAGLSIYDPSTAPGGKVTFKGILANFQERIHLASTFRQKMVQVPLDLDHPYWVEDKDFDLEFHVRHIALPKPGDWRQLCIQAARLHLAAAGHEPPVVGDYVIEGLDNVEGVPPGSFALLQKTHHAAIDGVSGMEMTSAIHDRHADAEPPATADSRGSRSASPSPCELLGRASVNNATRPDALRPRAWPARCPDMGRVHGPARAPTVRLAARRRRPDALQRHGVSRTGSWTRAASILATSAG